MFDHDIDQSLLLIGIVLGAFFALPFVMAWMEATLPDASRPRPSRAPLWVTVWAAVQRGVREGARALSRRGSD